MNWNNFTLILDVIGSVGIIISLIYLAKQLKQGTKNLKTTTRDSSFHSLMEWNYHIMSDSELAWIFMNGCKDFDSLSEIQKPRYLSIMYSYFKVFENIYLHYTDNSIDAHIWENNHKMFITYFVTPGAQYYWKERKLMLHPTFIKILENVTNAEMRNGQTIVEESTAK